MEINFFQGTQLNSAYNFLSKKKKFEFQNSSISNEISSSSSSWCLQHGSIQCSLVQYQIKPGFSLLNSVWTSRTSTVSREIKFMFCAVVVQERDGFATALEIRASDILFRFFLCSISSSRRFSTSILSNVFRRDIGLVQHKNAQLGCSFFLLFSSVFSHSLSLEWKSWNKFHSINSIFSSRQRASSTWLEFEF